MRKISVIGVVILLALMLAALLFRCYPPHKDGPPSHSSKTIVYLDTVRIPSWQAYWKYFEQQKCK